jgi:hypothetical protein
LKAVYINRCKSDKHAFHRVSGAGSAEASSQYYGRIHKDTKILEWNSIQLKQSVMNERLTFDLKQYDELYRGKAFMIFYDQSFWR